MSLEVVISTCYRQQSGQERASRRAQRMATKAHFFFRARAFAARRSFRFIVYGVPGSADARRGTSGHSLPFGGST